MVSMAGQADGGRRSCVTSRVRNDLEVGLFQYSQLFTQL